MQHQRPIFALGLRILCALAFATLSMLIKLAGESGVALPEIVFWRQAVTVPVVLSFLYLTGGLHRLRTQRLASHARRALVGMTAMVCSFAAIMLLPLAEATTISFTTPLFAVVFGALVMGEHVGPRRWSSVALGFAGVLVIAQPGQAPISAVGTAAGLFASLLLALINHQVRDLGRTEEPIRSVFYFAAFGAPMAAIFLPFFVTGHSGWQWLLLIGIGASGTIAQLLLAASLRHGAVASVIVMDYTSLIWATAYGWLLWDHLPPATTWLGAPLIIVAGLLIAWREHQLAKPPSPATSLETE